MKLDYQFAQEWTKSYPNSFNVNGRAGTMGH
jgi:hypothetical protein